MEKDGTVHRFAVDMRVGVGVSLLLGYASSLAGIGGGVVLVPVLVRVLSFPVLIATATSQFVQAIMSLSATLAHLASGSFLDGGLRRTILLGIGVLLGAQLGAALSKRVTGVWIMRVLAAAVAFVGIRILITAL